MRFFWETPRVQRLPVSPSVCLKKNQKMQQRLKQKMSSTRRIHNPACFQELGWRDQWCSFNSYWDWSGSFANSRSAQLRSTQWSPSSISSLRAAASVWAPSAMRPRYFLYSANQVTRFGVLFVMSWTWGFRLGELIRFKLTLRSVSRFFLRASAGVFNVGRCTIYNNMAAEPFRTK